MKTITDVTDEQIAAAFTEWERRFREDPGSFSTAAQKAAESAETYGEACAPFLLEILAEQGVDVR